MQNSPNFTIYNASAGSGKTFKLAEEYLSLLLSSPKTTSFQNILAITFTNKAVGEMKSRILDYLTFFSKEKQALESDAMFQLVQQNTGLSKRQIQNKSLLLLKEILNNYAAFEISTIDAFTHRIIRTFAKDLGLSMNFDIEMEAKQVLQLAVDRVVDRAGKEEKLTEVLINFALEKVNEDKSGDISRDILEAANLLLNEKDTAYLNRLKNYDLDDFKNLKTQLLQDIKFISEELKQIGLEFLDKLNDEGLSFNDFSRGSIPKYFDKLSKNHPSILFNTKWQETLQDEETYVTKKQSDSKKHIIFSMKNYIVEKFELSKRLFMDRKFYDKIQKNITQLSLLSAVKEEMESIKKEQNVMLISDFNKKISEEIKKQPAPFIFERLGEKFQHFFIDEFQDTSRMQWGNLIPLTGNALASLFDGNQPGSLTLVGDAKQSIYAWRGGDAHQFLELSSGQSPFPISPSIETLDTNYRSSREIISFNNNFFEYVGQQLHDEKLKYLFSENRLIQKANKTDTGFVNIKFIEPENNDDRHELYPKEVLEIIKAKERQGFRLEDICILVRNKKEGVAIAEYLNEQKVPIISSETLLINSDTRVQFLLDLLNVLNTNDDEMSKARLLDALSMQVSKSAKDFESEDIEERRFKFLSKSLNQKDKFWDILAELGYDFEPRRFLSLPFYDAVEYAIDKFDLDQSANAYLQFFLDEIFEFSQKQTGGLASFLNYWSSRGEDKSIISPEHQNAVQIMTIHKSKGLQFPVVIFPYAKQQIDYALNNHLWVKLKDRYKLPFALVTKPSELDQPLYNYNYQALISELEMENINIFYVALTRAAKELHIISEDDRSKNGTFKPNTFSGLLMGFTSSSKQLEIETNTNYSWGSLETPKHTKSQADSSHLKELVFHRPSQQINLNLVTTAGKLWNENLELAKQEGNLIHSLLSRIEYSSDLDNTLQWHQDHGYIDHKESKPYKELLKTLLFHPEIEAYYTKRYTIWNERDIYYQDRILRPDRVCLNDRDVYIIDYKTGAPSLEHTYQVKDYAKALSSLKYNVKKTLLIYITDSIEVKIV